MKYIVFYLFSLIFVFQNQVFSKSQSILSRYFDSFNPKWMRERFEKEFDPIKQQKVSKKDLDDFFKSVTYPNEFLRIKIINNHIYLIPFQNSTCFNKTLDRTKRVYAALKKILRLKKLPNLDFVLYLGDGLHENQPIPIFCFAKKKTSKNTIAIPDFEALAGIGHIYKEIDSYDKPYSTKLPKGFWRGSTTGGDYTVKNWETFPRSKACLFSSKNPELLDAKFTIVVGKDKTALEHSMKKAHILDTFVLTKDHLPYKFLIDIDGNSCTYSRLHWILYSNSLCLKQNSEFEQWYYTGLKPYIHYIPFKEDMSDFSSIVAWTLNNESDCERIIYKAKDFVKKNLTIYSCLSFFYKSLLEYAKCQKF